MLKENFEFKESTTEIMDDNVLSTSLSNAKFLTNKNKTVFRL